MKDLAKSSKEMADAGRKALSDGLAILTDAMTGLEAIDARFEGLDRNISIAGRPEFARGKDHLQNGINALADQLTVFEQADEMAAVEEEPAPAE